MKDGYAKAKTGEEVLIGKYTLEIREAYMYYRIERYMIDHPMATRKKAGQMARHAWRQKAAKSMQSEIKEMAPPQIGKCYKINDEEPIVLISWSVDVFKYPDQVQLVGYSPDVYKEYQKCFQYDKKDNGAVVRVGDIDKIPEPRILYVTTKTEMKEVPIS